jgi:hypothetical protein
VRLGVFVLNNALAAQTGPPASNRGLTTHRPCPVLGQLRGDANTSHRHRGK